MLVFFSSCVRKVDYTYPTGYTFAGDTHELEYKYFKLVSYAANSDKYVNSNRINKVERKSLCYSIVQLDCDSCNCNQINFKAEILVNLQPYHGQFYSNRYYPRVLINYKTKYIYIENKKKGIIEGYKYYGNSYFEYFNWIVITKPLIRFTLKGKL